ncbi:MAG: hypothetical protein GW914_01945 [Candidatus Aenigmarchaeota archaeon]|nr:hypothetical protein [Candidatus Aenigmarchaeota archaeon]
MILLEIIMGTGNNNGKIYKPDDIIPADILDAIVAQIGQGGIKYMQRERFGGYMVQLIKAERGYGVKFTPYLTNAVHPC